MSATDMSVHANLVWGGWLGPSFTRPISLSRVDVMSDPTDLARNAPGIGGTHKAGRRRRAGSTARAPAIHRHGRHDHFGDVI